MSSAELFTKIGDIENRLTKKNNANNFFIRHIKDLSIILNKIKEIQLEIKDCKQKLTELNQAPSPSPPYSNNIPSNNPSNNSFNNIPSIPSNNNDSLNKENIRLKNDNANLKIIIHDANKRLAKLIEELDLNIKSADDTTNEIFKSLNIEKPSPSLVPKPPPQKNTVKGSQNIREIKIPNSEVLFPTPQQNNIIDLYSKTKNVIHDKNGNPVREFNGGGKPSRKKNRKPKYIKKTRSRRH